MTDSTCVTCPIYRPDAVPHQPERPPVCDGDRRRLDRDLADIARLHERLLHPDPLPVDGRWYDTTWTTRDPNTKAVTRHIHTQRADPLAAIAGAGPIPGRRPHPSVTGSRERSAPTSLDAVDLTSPARQPNPTDAGRAHPDDTVGHLPAATTLDGWVRDWRDTLWPDQHLPAATVGALVGWLRAGSTSDGPGPRLDAACDRHPAIDEMAAEIRALRHALRAALGETQPPPELVHGVACRGCDLRTLVRTPGDLYEAECDTCGLLYTGPELAEWITRLGGYERSIRTPEQVRDLLRR